MNRTWWQGGKCLGSLETYLLCFGPEYIFQVSGKPFAQPLLRPVAGPDGQAKPGVSDFMAEPGPTEVAPARQGALREEDDVWAADDRGENRVLSEPVLAAAGRALSPSLPLSCACSITTEGRALMLLGTHPAAVRTPGGGSGCGGAEQWSPSLNAVACNKEPAPRSTRKTVQGNGSVYSEMWTKKQSRCENAKPVPSRDDQRRPFSRTPAASKQTGESWRARGAGKHGTQIPISDGLSPS